jgi:hypothetical protein
MDALISNFQLITIKGNSTSPYTVLNYSIKDGNLIFLISLIGRAQMLSEIKQHLPYAHYQSPFGEAGSSAGGTSPKIVVG